MSDHDRGAYTPHHDAPLSFDARRSRGRRAFPTTLTISLLILVGLGVVVTTACGLSPRRRPNSHTGSPRCLR